MNISRPPDYFTTCYSVLSMVAILCFQFGLYRVVAPLSFLCSISLASLFAILSIFGWSDPLQFPRKQAAFSFAVLCIIMYFLMARHLVTRWPPIDKTNVGKVEQAGFFWWLYPEGRDRFLSCLESEIFRWPLRRSSLQQKAAIDILPCYIPTQCRSLRHWSMLRHWQSCRSTSLAINLLLVGHCHVL